MNIFVDDSVVLYQYSGIEEWLNIVKLACPFFNCLIRVELDDLRDWTNNM